MKFFLVISIIAFWWDPMNSPGNIDISYSPLSAKLLEPKTKTSRILKETEVMTKRKMDHFGFKFRKHLLRKELK